VEDSRPLDELPNDLASDDVLYDDTFDSRSVHPIIQSCRAARARHGRKPAADRWTYLCHELADQDVGALRAAAETTLPGDLGRRAHPVCIERVVKQLLKRARSSPVAALRAATDDYFEPARRRQG
jgi:hypothetical protein